jgi:1-acyl-sn-glycerol-3-phosphate acyltransferase
MVRVGLTVPFWNIFFKLVIKTVFFSKVTKIDRRPAHLHNNKSPKGLYIANHQSFTDIPLLFSVFIIPPIMKKEVIYIPLFGICAYSAGGILVNRKNKNSRSIVFEQSKERLLGMRQQLQYYPEGTRQQGNSPILGSDKIKTALIEFAYDNNIPVYPVSMEGTQNTMVKSRIIPANPLGIILHAPVNPQEIADKKEFVDICWNKVIDGKKELESKIYT